MPVKVTMEMMMYPQPQIEALKAALAERVESLDEIRKAQWQEQLAAFIVDGGCSPCRGRGLVVTWDTMDCADGGLAEYADCPACNGRRGVLHPLNTKYDKWTGTTWKYPETEETKALAAEVAKAESAISKEKARWTVHAGCVVVASRKSTAKGALPMGAEATVIKFCENPNKVWVKDASGQSFWPTVGSLKVVCPKDSAKAIAPAKPEKGSNMPKAFRVKVGKKTEKAVLVTLIKDGTFASEQVWIPFSQMPDLKSAHGDAIIMIPDWLIKAKGIEQYALAPAAAVEVAPPVPVAAPTVEQVKPVKVTASPEKLATAAPVATQPPARMGAKLVAADVLDILFND